MTEENVNLAVAPQDVIDSAKALAENEGEQLVGWRAITEQVPGNPSRVRPVRYLVITDVGVYEILPDGLVVRAAVLHKFD